MHIFYLKLMLTINRSLKSSFFCKSGAQLIGGFLKHRQFPSSPIFKHREDCFPNTIERHTHSSTMSGDSQFNVVFVLGGPGAGKGTQCEKNYQDV